jgi:hypothetical protein
MHAQEFTCNQRRKASQQTVRCGYLATTCRAPAPRRAGGLRCCAKALLSMANRHHHEAPALRHRRIPEEYEATDPREANAPGQEDAAEEGESSEKGVSTIRWRPRNLYS